MLRYISNKQEWKGERIDGLLHPRSIEKLWSAEELARIGLEVYDIPNEPAEPRTICSFVEFMGLFTPSEQIAVASAAQTDPALKLWYDQAVASNWVSLQSGLVKAGMQALVTAGLLTEERSNAILGSTF